MKIGFLSLGCPKNLVDGEVMLGIARDAGHALTADASAADVIVVNTCAFIESARQESIDAILEMAQHKRDGRCARLVVTGCLAERYREDLRKEMPEIDALLGTGEVEQILDAIGDPGSGIRDPASGARGSAVGARGSGPVALGGTMPLAFHTGKGKVALSTPDRTPSADRRPPTGTPGSRIPDPGSRLTTVGARIPDPGSRLITPGSRLPTYLYDADTPRLLTTPRHYAYLKIAEGCDYTCAFCIIPTLRGEYRSRAADSIVREAESLAARGVRELLLISQDTTFFGIDRGERGALAALLRRLDGIDGLAWIRLLYLYPTTITDDVLGAMAECEKVCRYIDLPLQHASAGVLKRMRRPGNRRVYDRLLARIRDRVPGVTLRTTLIVGFPGETEEEFSELDGFVADTGFDHVGVFTYSHEEGTRAQAYADDVPAPVKRRRRHALMGRQKRIVRARLSGKVGTHAPVLVDGPSAEHGLVLQGRLEGQAPEIDSVVYLTDCDPSAYQSGDLVHSRIVAARGYDLLAAPIA